MPDQVFQQRVADLHRGEARLSGDLTNQLDQCYVVGGSKLSLSLQVPLLFEGRPHPRVHDGVACPVQRRQHARGRRRFEVGQAGQQLELREVPVNAADFRLISLHQSAEFFSTW